MIVLTVEFTNKTSFLSSAGKKYNEENGAHTQRACAAFSSSLLH
jgi:hypothetical protein